MRVMMVQISLQIFLIYPMVIFGSGLICIYQQNGLGGRHGLNISGPGIPAIMEVFLLFTRQECQ